MSLAFELHNVTAEIYRSGSITVYRVPVMDSTTQGYLSRLSADPVPYSATVITDLPERLIDAAALPNSRTWTSSQGAYCTSLPAPENKFSARYPTNLLIGFAQGSGGYLRTDGPHQESSPTYSPLATAGAFSDKFMDMDQVFTLDARMILEVIPSTQVTDPFLQFSGTTSPYDKLAISLYREMFNQIPPGAPVGHNASGDWFRLIVSLAKNALPLVANALPGQAKIIATAAMPVINGLIDKALANKSNAPTANVTQRMQPRPKTVIKTKPKKK